MTLYDSCIVNSPWYIVLDILKERNLNSEYLNTSIITNYLNEDTPITTNLAIFLEEQLNISVFFWFQKEYDYRASIDNRILMSLRLLSIEHTIICNTLDKPINLYSKLLELVTILNTEIEFKARSKGIKDEISLDTLLVYSSYSSSQDLLDSIHKQCSILSALDNYS